MRSSASPPHLLELAPHLTPGAGQHLHRQKKAEVEGVHQLGGIHHHHKTIGPAGHQLLLDMAGPAPLDQLEGGIHLIRPIDGQIDALDGIQALQGDPQLSGQDLSLKRRGDTGDVPELTTLQPGPQLLNHQSCGGSGSQPKHHSIPDLGHGRGGHGLLHLGLQIRHGLLRGQGART